MLFSKLCLTDEGGSAAPSPPARLVDLTAEAQLHLKLHDSVRWCLLTLAPSPLLPICD
jgi:hypothetical protein